MQAVHHNDMDSNSSRSSTAIRNDPPPAYWGDHDANPLDRLEPGWVASTWALCIALTLGLGALGTLFAVAVSDTPITGQTNTELGVLTIVAAMATFIAFAVVITARLVRVPHDRLVNSLAVAALHVAVAVVLFGIELALQALGTGAADIFSGSWAEQVGNAFAVLERSSAAAILAALLAVGMVPARGDRPSGTQVGATPQDRQL